ncbi:MAG: hypothetical protein J6Q84_02860 [Kiritimatiellae bacterium]|nr:hypothetical protein [Kiritimatiellia bacterium]
MANEVDNSKELNELNIKNDVVEVKTETLLLTLKSLACLFNEVATLRSKMKCLTYSVIFLAVSFIFMNLLYWL